MLNNPNIDPQMQGNMLGQQLQPGATVYGSGGDKVGTIAEYNTQGNYIVVQKGWLFPHDIYVPVSAIANTDQDGVYLNMTKDQIQSQGWDTPPTGNWGAGDIGANTTPVAGSAYAPDQTAADTIAAGNIGRGNVGNTLRNDVDIANPPGHSTPTQTGDIAIPVREEELMAQKQRGELGRVQVHRDVVEEQQSVNVPVTHEEVRVERIPVQGAADVGPDAFTDKDIDVPIMGEQVTAEKQSRVAEELHLHKQAVTEQQRFSDTVRRERVNVEGVDENGNLTSTDPNVVPIDDNGQPPYQR